MSGAPVLSHGHVGGEEDYETRRQVNATYLGATP